jgi:hypothetical protein
MMLGAAGGPAGCAAGGASVGGEAEAAAPSCVLVCVGSGGGVGHKWQEQQLLPARQAVPSSSSKSPATLRQTLHTSSGCATQSCRCQLLALEKTTASIRQANIMLAWNAGPVDAVAIGVARLLLPAGLIGRPAAGAPACPGAAAERFRRLTCSARRLLNRLRRRRAWSREVATSSGHHCTICSTSTTQPCAHSTAHKHIGASIHDRQVCRGARSCRRNSHAGKCRDVASPWQAWPP